MKKINRLDYGVGIFLTTYGVIKSTNSYLYTGDIPVYQV